MSIYLFILFIVLKCIYPLLNFFPAYRLWQVIDVDDHEVAGIARGREECRYEVELFAAVDLPREHIPVFLRAETAHGRCKGIIRFVFKIIRINGGTMCDDLCASDLACIKASVMGSKDCQEAGSMPR